MKRLFCIALCFLALCLSGCGNNEDTPSNSTTAEKIETIVGIGKFEDMEYGLGADVDTVKDYYSGLVDEYNEIHMNDSQDGEHSHVHDHEAVIPYYSLNKNDGYTEIDVSDVRFYYINKKSENGISVIATDKDVFGFTMGSTTKYDVEEAMAVKGETRNATEDDLRLLAFPTEPMVILRYEYENRMLDFYFYENMLVTVAIIDSENWE